MKPDSFWHRLKARLDPDDDDEVDESMIAFHLMFIVPIFLVLVMLVRR